MTRRFSSDLSMSWTRLSSSSVTTQCVCLSVKYFYEIFNWRKFPRRFFFALLSSHKDDNPCECSLEVSKNMMMRRRVRFADIFSTIYLFIQSWDARHVLPVQTCLNQLSPLLTLLLLLSLPLLHPHITHHCHCHKHSHRNTETQLGQLSAVAGSTPSTTIFAVLWTVKERKVRISHILN